MNAKTTNQSNSLEFGSIFDSVISQYRANIGNLSLKYVIILVFNWAVMFITSLVAGLTLFATQIPKIQEFFKRINDLDTIGRTGGGIDSSQTSSFIVDAITQFGPAFLIFILILIIVSFLLSAYITSFLTRSTNQLARDNQVIPIGKMFKFDQDYYLNYILATILVGFAVGLGTLFFILPGIYLALRMQFVLNLVVDGKHSAIDAISESFRLTSGNNVWSVLLNNIIFFGIYIGVLLVTTIVFSLLSALGQDSFAVNLVIGTLQNLFSLGLGIIVAPLFALINSQMYIRLQNLVGIED